jgi:hypothetical protein
VPADKKELARVYADLRGTLSATESGSKRLDLILSSSDPGGLVRSLPAQDVYLLIKDIGVASAGELVGLASSTQFRTFLDLDGWKKDRFEVPRALAWIIAARSRGAPSLDRKLRDIDLEVVELVLRATTRVFSAEETPDLQTKGVSYRTPDGQYVVEITVDGPELEAVRGVIDRLYERDPIAAARFLEACRWDIPSELEETAYRFRSGRLADLGFPDLAEALSYLAYRDPDAPVSSEAVRVPQSAGFFLSRLVAGAPFLDQVVSRLDPEARDRFSAALPLVANAVLVFESVDVGEPADVQRAMQGVRDTLSLGVEHAARGDPERGAAILAKAPLKDLFRIGVSLALKLKFRADSLMRTGRASFPTSSNTPLFDTPIAEAIVAVRHRRPLYAPLVEGPSGAVAPRHFRSRAEIGRVEAAIAAGEKVSEVFKALGFDSAAAEAAVQSVGGEALLAQARFSDLFLTAMARDSVGEAFAFSAFPRARVGEALDRTFEVAGGETRVRQAFSSRLHDRLRSAAQDDPGKKLAEDFADLCLLRLLNEIGRPFAASRSIDPKVQLPWIVA